MGHAESSEIIMLQDELNREIKAKCCRSCNDAQYRHRVSRAGGEFLADTNELR